MNLFDKIKAKFGFGKTDNVEEVSSGSLVENKFEAWEDYLYPGTNILKNRFNLKDIDYLTLAETFHTAQKSIELEEKPLEGSFDYQHLKKIHKYYFERVYEWAGEIRNVNMGKMDDEDKEVHWFCPFKEIESKLNKILNKLKDENHLKGLNSETFSERAGYYLGEINYIHPFREGNGRTQRTFIGQIAMEAGYKISWDGIKPEQMIRASIEAHKGDSTNLAELIKSNLTIIPIEQEVKIENQSQTNAPIQNTTPAPSKTHENSTYKNLFDAYAKKVFAETGQKWTDETNRLIAEKMLKNKISPSQVRSALKYSPKKIENIPAFVSKIENEPEIKAILKGPGGMRR